MFTCLMLLLQPKEVEVIEIEAAGAAKKEEEAKHVNVCAQAMEASNLQVEELNFLGYVNLARP